MTLINADGKESVATINEHNGSVIIMGDEESTGCQTSEELEKYMKKRYSSARQYKAKNVSSKERDLISKYGIDWIEFD